LDFKAPSLDSGHVVSGLSMSNEPNVQTQRRGVLVTGGASGIGQAVVKAFAELGDITVCLDVSPCKDAAHSVIGDVRDSSAHRIAVDTTLEHAGTLDVLVVNAGVHDGGMGLELDATDFVARMRTILDINVIGYALALQAAEVALRDSRGCVVMTSSDAAYLEGQTGAGIGYTASKYAVSGIARWAARAFAPHVRVNVVAPGGVMTNLPSVGALGTPGSRLFQDETAKRASIASRTILGTVMEPNEIAELYVFLASGATRGLTGAVLRPDGGLDLR